MKTEKATDALDLPHPLDLVDHRTETCVCGRYREDQLHSQNVNLPEHASHSVLTTEKGS